MSSTKIAWISVIGVLVFGISIILMNARDLYKGIPAEINPKEVLSEYNDWHAFSSLDGEFEVMLPTIPEVAQETVRDQKTHQLVRYDLYVSSKPDGTVFVVLRKAYPDQKSMGDTKVLLQNYLQDILSSGENSVLIASNEDKFRGHQALNYSFRNDQVFVEGVAFIVGNTLYSISYSTNILNHELGDYQYFIESFSLK